MKIRTFSFRPILLTSLIVMMPLIVSAQVDTVDWSNLNLNYKPPMPGQSRGQMDTMMKMAMTP